MGENCKQVTDSSFESDVLKAPGVVLVDFWAEWCGPCRALGPVLEEVAGELAGKVTIGKMNVDQNPETPTQYGVRSIPTLLLFKEGELVETKVGSLPKEELISWLESA